MASIQQLAGQKLLAFCLVSREVVDLEVEPVHWLMSFQNQSISSRHNAIQPLFSIYHNLALRASEPIELRPRGICSCTGDKAQKKGGPSKKKKQKAMP